MNQREAGENVREAKSRLRLLMGDRVASLAPAERREADRRIRSRLQGVAAGFHRHTLLAYRALADEVDLDPLLGEMAESGWEVYLPRVVESGALRIARWEPGTAMSRDSVGVQAPAGVALEHPQDAGGLALVPGRAFDAHGGRIGRGRGFYDRLLADGRAGWFSVGIAYECQLVDAVPREGHDRAIDALATEGSYRVFGGAGQG